MSAFAYFFVEHMTEARADRRTGSRNPQAKIDEAIARRIKERVGTFEDGRLQSVRVVAADIGIGKSTVHAIVSGRKWRHV